MSEPKANNVPRFGSFRPKPVAPAPEPVEAKANARAEVRLRSTHEEKEDRRRHHRRPRSRSRERSHAQTQTEVELSRASPKIDSPEIFIIDRKGDVKNLVYGSVHRYSVPPFYRHGAGYVLGASLDVKIDRNYPEDKGVVLSNWKRKINLREKYIFSKIEKAKPRFLKIRPEATTEDSAALESDFVPLQTRRGKKRKRGVDGESSSEEEQRDYRSIYGRTKSKDQPLDEDLQYATESELSGSDTGRTIKEDSSIRQKNVELSRKVEESPQDISAWLALIDHQDVLMEAGDNRRRITTAEIKSTADIKIHMYEKALENSQSLEERERILLGIMTEGAKIWEVKTQSDRWEQISQENIDSLMLWTSYLNFKQSAFTTFRYEDVKDVYLKRVKLLLGAIEKATGDAIGTRYQQLLYVILRLTLFTRESGYTELAVAIWQGLLEINFHTPKKPLPEKGFMESFKDFWESEVARIGEEGALGWSHHVANESNIEIPNTFTDEEDDSLDNSDIFRTWATAERIRMKCSHKAARTMDEVVEDDPYRVIMFSDIEDFLITLPTQADDLRKLCVDAFLLFCRLPPIATPDSETSRKWTNDAFLRDELLECRPAWMKDQYFTRSQHGNEDDGMPSFQQNSFPNCLASPELLFGTGLAGNYYFGKPSKSNETHTSPFRARYQGDNGPVSYTWIRNILKQLTRAQFTEDLAEYYLAFEFHNESLTIKKIAKALLKQHPSSLRLYNAYAMIEWYRGNKGVANEVFSAALNMGSLAPKSDKSTDSIILWRNWAWLCLEDSDNEPALNHLLCIADGKPDPSITLSPTAVLRAKQHLTSTRDYLLSSGAFAHAILYTDTLALLTYLTAAPTTEPQSPIQGSISPALQIYTAFSTTLQHRTHPSSTTAHELLLQSAARLLLHHTSVGPFRPALLRSNLTNFLTHFPRNTILLSMYTWTESRLRVENRVRSMLLSTILTPQNDTLSSRIFGITYELQHGTIHSAKSAFEHALCAPSCKSSAGLWRLYILFCSETRSFRGMVKDVWFRALRACPWAKELYMVGLERSIEGLGWEEMRGTWMVMGEKELRVHVDLEDRFEEIGEMGVSAQKRVGYGR